MKRNLILTFLACGASVLLGTAAQAQTPTPAPTATPACSACPVAHKHGGGGGLLGHLTQALSLSGSQQAQIAPILEQAKPQLKTIHDNAVAQRKTVIESVSSQVTPLLTADQQAKFAQLVQKFENGPGPGAPRFRHFGAGAPGASPGAHVDMLQKLTTELSLTTDQQNQIKPILDAAHAQVQAVHHDTTLTQEQKFAKVKETMEAAHSQIKGILTPAQQQTLEAMKAKFHRGHGPESQPSASPSATAN